MKKIIYSFLFLAANLFFYADADAACSVTINPSGTAGVCVGNCLSLTATPTGSGPFTYQWSTGQTTATVQVCSPYVPTISVTVTDATSCSATTADTIVINLPPTPLISCIGDTLVLDNNSFYVSYQWCFNTFPIPGATDTFYVVTQPGNYSVVVTDLNGCTASASTPCVVGISDPIDKNIFSVYPSVSSSGIFYIKTNEQYRIRRVSITDYAGRVVCTIDAFPAASEINLTSCSNGIYFYAIEDEKQRVYRGKMVKE